MPAALTPSFLRYWRLSRPRDQRARPGPRCVGWSQARAAAHLGVSLRTFHRWERGLRPCPRLVALAIKRSLNRPPPQE